MRTRINEFVTLQIVTANHGDKYRAPPRIWTWCAQHHSIIVQYGARCAHLAESIVLMGPDCAAAFAWLRHVVIFQIIAQYIAKTTAML